MEMKRCMKYALKLYCVIYCCIFFCACSTRVESDRVHHVGRFVSGDYPLMVLSPDFTVFAVNDTLPEYFLRLRDGRDFPLVALLKVDDVYYRFIGKDEKWLKALAPVASDGDWVGKYTFLYPDMNWMNPNYDDSHWLTGNGAFGTEYIDDIHTFWASRDIYVRRKIPCNYSYSDSARFYLRYVHDEAINLFINGHELLNTGYAWNYHGIMEIPSDIVKTMRDTTSIIAAHCNNLAGKGVLDFGIYVEEKRPGKVLSAILTDVDMQASQTYYTFRCGTVELKFTVLAPYGIDDLNMVSLPLNFLTYEICALDGKIHDTEIVFELSTEKIFGKNTLNISQKDGLYIMQVGSVEQNLWINKDTGKPSWGFFYWAMKGEGITMLTDKDGKWTSVIAKSIGVKKNDGHLLIAFDELSPLQYFGENLHPCWNKDGVKSMKTLLSETLPNYSFIRAKCDQFDDDYMLKGYRLAGDDWAQHFLLPYRNLWSCHRLAVTTDEDIICFADTVGNVRATYELGAMSLFWNSSTERIKALINPIFQYSESGKWNKSYPAYDVGSYPIARAQINEGEYPVLSASNMLLLTAAITRADNSSDYARKHWNALTRWGNFLINNDSNNDSVKEMKVDTLLPSYTLEAKRALGISAYSELVNHICRKK